MADKVETEAGGHITLAGGGDLLTAEQTPDPFGVASGFSISNFLDADDEEDEEQFMVTRSPLGYQQLTVSGTAVGLTLPTRGVVRIAVVVVETNSIRYRDDGTVPTASVGTPVPANGSIAISGAAISSFRAIRTGSDAVLNIHYYGDV